MRFLLLAILIFLGFPFFAGAENLSWRGEIFPSVVDLSYQLTLDSAKGTQCATQVGGSCHIYSGATLAEMYCFRKTGVYNSKALKWENGLHMHFSRAYLFSQHLRDEFSNPSVVRELSVKGWTDFVNPGQFTTADGGYPQDTIRRIELGNTVTDVDQNFSKSFFAEISVATSAEGTTLWRKSLTPQQPESKKRYSEYVCSKLDAVTQRCFPKDIKTGSAGLVVESKDPEIQKCLKEPMNPIVANWDFATAVRTLKRQVPFACLYTTAIVNADGRNSVHAVVILGYRWDTKTNTIRYLVRDSNLATPAVEHPSLVTCDRGIIILN